MIDIKSNLKQTRQLKNKPLPLPPPAPRKERMRIVYKDKKPKKAKTLKDSKDVFANILPPPFQYLMRMIWI